MAEKPFINILIAEDNQVSREMMAKVLGARGFNILHAKDGDEAIAIIKKESVDIALVDINMAPTGGFEFVKFLVVRGIDVPVVVITGDDSSDLLTEASSLGVMRVLQKPVAPTRLTDTVVHILKRRGFNPDHMGVAVHDTKFSGEDLMHRAIELAENNYKSGKGGPYGAVLADQDGKILGEGVNGIMARSDPTAHAEVMAIRQAAEKLKDGDMSKCILYVSSEPTMMGKALILSVGIPKVYVGLSHDEIKSVRMSEEKVRRELTQTQQQPATEYIPLGHEEAMDMFQGWIKFENQKRSGYLISKTASISTATPSGSDGAPTAKRACFPASPSTATIRSEAPFTTAGCWVKSEVQLTNAPSLTQRTTWLQSPSIAALTCPRILSAQACAALTPSSSSSVSPRRPICIFSPFRKGI